jgi:arylsulfatase A-like enzyme
MAKRAVRYTRRQVTTGMAAGLGLVALGPKLAAAQETRPVIAESYADSVEGPAPVPPDASGKPNVIWVLLDDVGYGASSAFGGGAQTPVLESLAREGLSFTNFHTTAVCSPSRAALLTGRNHNKVGMGMLPQKLMAAEFPGYTGRLMPEDGTIADYLRAAGYSTYFIGKSHLTPDEESTDLGPFDRWPSGLGFDHSFFFHGGLTDQYKPDLVEDSQRVQPDGRHLTTQLADRAIRYIDKQREIAPERPFFMYFSTGATHDPIQVDREWIDKYKGKFDAGWDVYREETFARQKELGVIPENAVLPPRNPRVPAWDSLSDDQKKVYARFMEAYAGFFEHTDHEIGRLIDHLRGTGQLDNTVIFFMVGDNGGDLGGGPNGGTTHIYPKARTQDFDAELADLVKDFDRIGTGEVFSAYPYGWSQATNTPWRDWKTQADSAGGTRNPLVVYWPQGLQDKGGKRNQFTHLIDVLPTTLEIVGATVPATVDGFAQTPVQGISFVYSFNDPSAPERHTTQYFHLYGAGAIYHEGWKASFSYHPDFIDLYHSFPPPEEVPNNAGKEVWELYNVNDDPTELNNLAPSNPEKLAEMKALFHAEAVANDVYPLINWSDLHERVVAVRKAGGSVQAGGLPEE